MGMNALGQPNTCVDITSQQVRKVIPACHVPGRMTENTPIKGGTTCTTCLKALAGFCGVTSRIEMKFGCLQDIQKIEHL